MLCLHNYYDNTANIISSDFRTDPLVHSRQGQGYYVSSTHSLDTLKGSGTLCTVVLGDQTRREG